MRTVKFLLVALVALPVIFVAQTGNRVFPAMDSITGAPPLDAFRSGEEAIKSRLSAE